MPATPCSRARCRNTATPSSVNTWNCAARKPPTSASCAPPSTPSRIRPSRRAWRPARDANPARLHAEVSSGSWQQAAQTAQALLNLPQVHTDADLASTLRALLDAPALARLQRLDALASDPRVRQYEAIREKQGPRSGSEEANAQGLLARQRGVAVEILAARARRWRGIWTRRPHPNHAMVTHRPATAW